jgi:carboxyl-terminal processing protease
MTIAQFFRINGGTTQLRGVTPDISFPSIISAEDFGESSYDNALPWTQIKAADYTPAGKLIDIVPLLIANHEMRVSKDKDFQYLREDIAELNTQRKKNLISLNEAERRKERETQEVKVKLREKDSETDKGSNAADKKAVAKNAALQDDGLQSSERDLDTDLALEKSRKNAKDVLLNEAVHILSDEVALLKANAKLATSVLPKSNIR